MTIKKMSSVKRVSDDLIRAVSMNQSKFWLLRWDVLPFIIYYTVFFTFAISENNIDYKYIGLIGLPIGFVIHLLLFLLAQYSVSVRCFLGYNPIADISKAEHMHVTAAKNAGKDRLVKIMRNNYFSSPIKINIMEKFYAITKERLEFQKVIYNYDADDKKSFIRLEYPDSGSLADFLLWRGHEEKDSVALSLMRWGANEFDIPIPNFLDLYLDHLVAPFFVFQVICLFLWSLDDYWYYSAFTLLMLMFFEGMMCKQRQQSLLMLRNMRRPPINIFVFRMGQWFLISSDTVVPGDIISLTADSIAQNYQIEQEPDSEGKIRRRQTKNPSRGHDDSCIVPCDALLVRGSCVVNEAMLTGESVPQMKESIRARTSGSSGELKNIAVDLSAESAVQGGWKRHMVYGGTSLVQHSQRAEADGDGLALMEELTKVAKNSSAANKKSAIFDIPSPPDAGCLAIVIRTGFATSQGGLMRKILFATERVTGGSAETFYFIGVLVIFALLAASVVLHYGLGDEKRNKFRLVLHCIMIITSVVPPELPMELSLAVTNSLGALARSLVYCTEPFRIAFAGRLDVVCFDKTGTLTKDQMMLRGVVAPQNLPFISKGSKADPEVDLLEEFQAVNQYGAHEVVIEASYSPDIVLAMMGCCHDLISSPAKSDDDLGLIGDPLEIATVSQSGFQFESREGAASKGNYDATTGQISLVNSDRGIKANIRQKYPFTSELKRMSVLAEVSRDNSKGDKELMVFTKGAPEIIASYLKAVPPFYHATYHHHMCKGRRVLVMACKKLSAKASGNKKLPRTEVESDLEFVCFLVFDCDLKVDSKSVIREIKSAAHKVVMITGDSVYTAADVGRRLGMLKTARASSDATKKSKGQPSALILHAVSDDSENSSQQLVWRQLGEAYGNELKKGVDDIDFNLGPAIKDLSDHYSLCVTGAALSILQEKYLDKTSNMTDKKRRAIVMQQLCPYVAVFARVSPTQKESILLALNEAGLYTLMCGDGTNDVGALKAAHVGVSIVNDPEFEKRIEGVTDSSNDAGKDKKTKGGSSRDRMARAIQELHEQEQDPTIVKLGDASIASPFTARRTSIDSVLTVIRQGRCTLVTTIQVYKVLALNCLISAYMMSALYLRGLKQGDTQMTATGLVIAALFFFLSQAKPLLAVAPNKPPSTVFAKAVILSLLGQFIVHFCSLFAVLHICERYVDADDFSLSADGKFQPNIVNSAVFLLCALMQVNNFVVNYRGHPFTQSISENAMLWRSVQVLYAVFVIVAGGQVEPLNDLLQLAPFPDSQFQAYLVGILVFNFAAAYGIEQFCRRLE